MIRRDVWEALKGLDENFHPVWFEDTDFCRRALDRGYRIRFVPACAARHQGGHSVLRVEPAARGVFWYGSLLRYAAKHFGALGFRAVCLAVVAGAAGRAVIGCMVGGLRSNSNPGDLSRWERWSKIGRMCGTIIRLAGSAFISGKVPGIVHRDQAVPAVEH
jgi:hypothetical protein